MSGENFYLKIYVHLAKLVACTKEKQRVVFSIGIVAFALHGCATVEGISEDFSTAVSKIKSDDQEMPISAPNNQSDLVREVQRMLKEQGYSVGTVDGKSGPATRKALRQFQVENNYNVTDSINSEAYIQLSKSSQSKSAESTPVSKSKASKPECEQNFKRTNDGLVNYQTYASLGTVSASSAVDRVARQLMKEGYSIQQKSSKEGIISAGFDPGGLNLQFSAAIEEESGGKSRAELTLALAGGTLFNLLLPAAPYRADLCNYIEIMKGN